MAVTLEKPTAFEANFLDDEVALAEMASLEEVNRVKAASLASLSSEAFRAGVSPPLDPAFIADEKFLSEDSNDSDASIVEISSGSDSDASSTEDSDDEDSSAELPDKPEAPVLIKSEPSTPSKPQTVPAPSRLTFTPFSQTPEVYYSDDEDDEDQPPSKKEILSDESTSEDFEYFRGELNLFEEDIASVLRDLGSIRIAAFGVGEADKPDDALCAPYRAGKVTLRRYGEVCDRVEALLSCYPCVKVTTEKDV
ncbi:hypothetical protein NXS19_011379 [Fusarium pseudograminearum]|nr:hypothetical protein NXS19_011379 [Fusarium pseudograminearum]